MSILVTSAVAGFVGVIVGTLAMRWREQKTRRSHQDAIDFLIRGNLDLAVVLATAAGHIALARLVAERTDGGGVEVVMSSANDPFPALAANELCGGATSGIGSCRSDARRRLHVCTPRECGLPAGANEWWLMIPVVDVVDVTLVRAVYCMVGSSALQGNTLQAVDQILGVTTRLALEVSVLVSLLRRVQSLETSKALRVMSAA
jgi:hypothetical protein